MKDRKVTGRNKIAAETERQQIRTDDVRRALSENMSKRRPQAPRKTTTPSLPRSRRQLEPSTKDDNFRFSLGDPSIRINLPKWFPGPDLVVLLLRRHSTVFSCPCDRHHSHPAQTANYRAGLTIQIHRWHFVSGSNHRSLLHQLYLLPLSVSRFYPPRWQQPPHPGYLVWSRGKIC